MSDANETDDDLKIRRAAAMEMALDSAQKDNWKEVQKKFESLDVQAAIDAAQARIKELENRLTEIGDYAHEHSTGPEVPDALWTVRAMAYE